MAKNEHAPSQYRKIIKSSRLGKGQIELLVKEARDLSEPYYVSLALVGLSMDSRLGSKEASGIRNEALDLIDEEKRGWRRAELISKICKSSKRMKDAKFKEMVMGKIPLIEEPKARAEAIGDSMKYLGCENVTQLFQIASQNEEQVMNSCKPVIKFRVKERCGSSSDIITGLDMVKDKAERARLLGYLQLQLLRINEKTTEPMERAVDLILSLKSDERLEPLKYLASQSEDIDTLEIIAASITGLETVIEEASLLSTLAGSADRAGQKEMALDWFNSALECLNEVEDEKSTAGIRLNLAIGLQRLGHEAKATENFELALKGAGGNEKLTSRIQKSMGMASEIKSMPEPHKERTRHVLALYDTYEGGLSTPHLRMVATAAPLCIAYGLDLALMKFPTEDVKALVKKISADTNVGKGGLYLEELVKEGRIMINQDMDSIGLPIATTSRPDSSKSISMKKAGKKAKGHEPKRLCVIMGLGRKGLPKSLLKKVDYHLELTGCNVPLETATAMGILAQQMGHLD